ncbi:RICIN domain-containing protein [Streptomyces lavendulae]|uniref:RICIN domain-containing protein n=1 Tax=Streptomyces lavendulae TaxID=1914 RepID=UPI003697A84E
MGLYEGERYVIVNRLSGTVLDSSNTDGGVSVRGWENHGGHNQQWVLIDNDGHWYIRNVQSGRYLAPANHNFDDIHDGTPLVGSDAPFHFDIKERDDDEYRMYVAGFPRALNADLADGGNPANGTKVVLWGQVDESRNQLWRFEKV